MVGVEGFEEWNSALEDVAWVLGEVLRSVTNSNSEHAGKRVHDFDTIDASIDETGAGNNDSHYTSIPRHPKR